MRFSVSDVEEMAVKFVDDKGVHLQTVLGTNRIRFAVNTDMVHAGFGQYPAASPLLQAVHMAFQNHMALRIEPAYFWTTILQEVATMVKLDPERFAAVFNGDPANKRTIKVRHDGLLVSDSFWPEAIAMFRDALAVETGPELVKGFFPGFSADDPTRELVYLISAMDAASPYFKYEVFSMCGIREIDLQGTADDWAALYGRIQWLENTFGNCEYFLRLKAIVKNIGYQIHENKPKLDFWKDMYKFDSQSKGDEVTGWVSDLFAHTVTETGIIPKHKWDSSYGLNEFPAGLSVVKFDWMKAGERYPMRFFAGFTGIKVEGNDVVPQIGYGVIEGDK